MNRLKVDEAPSVQTEVQEQAGVNKNLLRSGQRAENKGQERRQRTKDRGQRREDKGQKTRIEDRGERTEKIIAVTPYLENIIHPCGQGDVFCEVEGVGGHLQHWQDAG